MSSVTHGTTKRNAREPRKRATIERLASNPSGPLNLPLLVWVKLNFLIIPIGSLEGWVSWSVLVVIPSVCHGDDSNRPEVEFTGITGQVCNDDDLLAPHPSFLVVVIHCLLLDGVTEGGHVIMSRSTQRKRLSDMWGMLCPSI